jgi:Na+/proline symporter
MLVTAQGSMLPAWVVLLVGVPTLLGIAAHVLSLQRASMPRTRRRLRTASGVLMMLVTGLLAYAIGIAEVPERPRIQPGAAGAFVLVWSVIVGLLAMVVLLAIMDALLTTSAGIRAHRNLQDRAAGAIRDDIRRHAAETESSGSRGSDGESGGGAGGRG